MLCSLCVLIERDCVWGTSFFHSYHIFWFCVTRIRLALARATNFLTRYIEAVVPWHITVRRKVSKFIRRNVFSAVTSFTLIRQNGKPTTLAVILQGIPHPFNEVTLNGD